jgi:hypothetical protein
LVSDNEDAHDVGEIAVDDHPDEDDGIVWAEDGEAAPIGGKITVGRKLHRTTGAVLAPGKIWTRVEGMGEDARKEEEETVDAPTFQLKNANIDDDTTELELFLLMLPVTIKELFEVVKCRAQEANDKCKGKWHKEHVVAYLLVLFGASQFKTGTEFWEKEKLGCMPAPDFGQCTTKDRFLRVQRHLAKGPEGADAKLATDPWAQFRWLVGGFNATRKREIMPGSKINPDGTMRYACVEGQVRGRWTSSPLFCKAQTGAPWFGIENCVRWRHRHCVARGNAGRHNEDGKEGRPRRPPPHDGQHAEARGGPVC